MDTKISIGSISTITTYKTIPSIVGVFKHFLYDITNIPFDTVNNVPGVKNNGILCNIGNMELEFNDDLSVFNFSSFLLPNKFYALLTEYTTNGQVNTKLSYFKTLPKLQYTAYTVLDGDILIDYTANHWLAVTGAEKRARNKSWGFDGVHKLVVDNYLGCSASIPQTFQTAMLTMPSDYQYITTYRAPDAFIHAASLGEDYFIPDVNMCEYICRHRHKLHEFDPAISNHQNRFSVFASSFNYCYIASSTQDTGTAFATRDINMDSYRTKRSVNRDYSIQPFLTVPVRLIPK